MLIGRVEMGVVAFDWPAFCGHTHFARESQFGSTRGINIGGDYHFKRLVRLEWPTGTVQASQFGEA